MTAGRIRAAEDTVWLTPVAVAGQILSMVVALTLAHLLPPAAFETYVMAASLFIVLMALAPLGSEKLALRVLPPLLDAALWPDVAAFLRFAGLRSLMGTLLAVVAVLVWAGLADNSGAPMWQALALLCLALPFGVGTQVGQEVLTAAGRADLAIFAARVVPPLVAGLAVAVALLAGWEVGSSFALGGWALGWAVAAGLILWTLRRVLKRGAASDSRAQRADWAGAARPLWFYRIATGVRSQAGIIALLWFGAASGQVGAFATAQALTGLFLVPVVATNRIYARDLARFIHRGDPAAIRAMLRRRLTWVLPVAAALVGLVWWGGDALLGAVRPEFVAAGTGPLRVLTVSAAVAMLLALGPTWLKFLDRGRLVLGVMGGGAMLHLGLLMVLVPQGQATGAALAYAIPTMLGYAVLAVMADKDRTTRRR